MKHKRVTLKDLVPAKGLEGLCRKLLKLTRDEGKLIAKLEDVESKIHEVNS